MSRNLNNMSIDEFIEKWLDKLSNLSSPNYIQALTRGDIINARNIMSGVTHPMIAPSIPKTYYPSNVEEIMSERMPTRAKIVKLTGENETEDADYVKYIGQTFKVVGEISLLRKKIGYKLCLNENYTSLDSVRFNFDELELYYDDEVKGEY